jgi:8-oxo-dGTP pyrophosphatase MutT (NUDIX family)
MGHIHSDSEYDYTASATIVYKNKVLLLFHHKLHLWLPPAGHIELHEHPLEALYRETKEETGLTKDHLTLITPFTDNLALERDPSTNLSLPMPFDIDVHTVNEAGHRHIDFSYIFLSDTDVIHKEEGGAEQLEWFTLEEIKHLSPMPKKVYSNAEYALKQAGDQK